jgi:hypothetical protein
MAQVRCHNLWFLQETTSNSVLTKNKRTGLLLANGVAVGSFTRNWLQKWTDQIANYGQT